MLHILDIIWIEILFRPLLNILIGLYNTIAYNNLGLAIIWLTVVFRIILLPASLSDEDKEFKMNQLQLRLKDLKKRFGNNPSVLREQQKKAFREFRFKRWPKIILLGVQGLILVVLYQVFLGGIYLEKIVDQLYSFIHVPISINATFLFWHIDHRSFILSFLCAAYLFWNIYSDTLESKKKLKQSDLIFILGFPLGTFLVLWYLPAVKSLFILTSMLFSTILEVVTNFKRSIKKQEEDLAKKHKERVENKRKSLPKVKERFN